MAKISCILQGGIGNQLFIMATTIAHSWRCMVDYCIPTQVINPHYPLSPDQKPVKFPNVKYCDGELAGRTAIYKETDFHYTGLPVFLTYNNQILSGYFQSYRYFDDFRKGILSVFNFDGIVSVPDVCSLHYRAGDYKKYSNHHPVISKEYIQSAIVHMMSLGYKKFLVFSDEIGEIKTIIEELGFVMQMFSFSISLDPLYELKLMASCSSNIIANSTFSWWASYINPNPNKTIIAPRNWFGPDSAHNDTKDLYLPGTIIL